MKKHGFIKCLAALAAIYAVLIAIGSVALWRYLRHYEQQHPVGAMNAYFEALRQDKRDKILEDSAFPFDEINTADAYWQYLRTKYADGDRHWQYAEVPQEDETAQDGKTAIYDVYAEDRRHGRLTLEKAEKGWRVRSDYTLTTLTVTAAEVPLLDGVSLLPYRTDGGHAAVAAFDGAGGTIPATDTYTVSVLSEGTLSLPRGSAVKQQDGNGGALLTAVPSDADRETLTAFAKKRQRPMPPTSAAMRHRTS